MLFTLCHRFPLCSILFRRLELPLSVLLFRTCLRYKALCSVQALCLCLGSDFSACSGTYLLRSSLWQQTDRQVLSLSLSLALSLCLLFVSDVGLSVCRLCLMLGVWSDGLEEKLCLCDTVIRSQVLHFFFLYALLVVNQPGSSSSYSR